VSFGVVGGTFLFAGIIIKKKNGIWILIFPQKEHGAQVTKAGENGRS